MGTSHSKRLEDLSRQEFADHLVESFGSAYAEYKEAFVDNGVSGRLVASLNKEEVEEDWNQTHLAPKVPHQWMEPVESAASR